MKESDDVSVTATASAAPPSYLHKLRRKAHRITAILHDSYGSDRHNNKDDPLDELVFILLSLMTTHPSYNRVFDRLKREVPEWEYLADMPTDRLREIIKDAGLSHQKASRIQSIVREVKAEYGTASLDSLRDLPDNEVEDFLTKLPGVGL